MWMWIQISNVCWATVRCFKGHMGEEKRREEWRVCRYYQSAVDSWMVHGGLVNDVGRTWLRCSFAGVLSFWLLLNG